MTHLDNKTLVMRAHHAFVSGDTTTLEDCLADDCILHQCGFLQPVVGAETIAELAAGAERRLADRERSVVSVVAEGDMVAIRSTTVGTHTNPMFCEATGKRITFDTMTFSHVHDGKVTEIWNIQDTASVLSQLGAWPDNSAESVAQ
jgi:steroid delta-isomerase-like uncharacterized protein